ncbi:MAG: hypothetical protein AAB354_11935 [candidate division KSB1 bacterium]
MAIEVTLALSENLVEDARRFGTATRRDVQTVLAGVLEMMWPTLDKVSNHLDDRPVASLSDSEVLALSEAQMTMSQQDRFEELQTKGKEIGLTADERQELLRLRQIYEISMLRKSEALAEAVQRGLREPMHP